MGLSNLISKINTAYKKQQEEAEKRAEKRMAKLRTKTAREREMMKLATEKAKSKRDLEQARTAASRAEVARKKAHKEASDLGLSGLFSAFTGKKTVTKRAQRKPRKVAKVTKTKTHKPKAKAKKKGRRVTFLID